MLNSSYSDDFVTVFGRLLAASFAEPLNCLAALCLSFEHTSNQSFFRGCLGVTMESTAGTLTTSARVQPIIFQTQRKENCAFIGRISSPCGRVIIALKVAVVPEPTEVFN